MRLIPPWQQPRLRRGCCRSAHASWPAEVAPGHIRQFAAEDHNSAHHYARRTDDLTRPRRAWPFPPFPPPADTTSSVWPSIDPIRLLHTCGIRGGSGSPEGGDDGPQPLCWVRNEIRSGDGSGP